MTTSAHVQLTIAVRHGVTAEQFEAAWVERIDLVVRDDDSYESVGAMDAG